MGICLVSATWFVVSCFVLFKKSQGSAWAHKVLLPFMYYPHAPLPAPCSFPSPVLLVHFVHTAPPTTCGAPLLLLLLVSPGAPPHHKQGLPHRLLTAAGRSRTLAKFLTLTRTPQENGTVSKQAMRKAPRATLVRLIT